jgi:hypothetical protein
MQATWRSGSLHDTALAALLGVHVPIAWQAVAPAHAGSAGALAGTTHVMRFPLPDLPAAHWLVPSYARVGSTSGYRCSLVAQRADGTPTIARLASVGACPAHTAATPGAGIETPIDAFVTTEALHAPVLLLECVLPATDDAPDREWFSCSVRPARLDEATLAHATGHLQGSSAQAAPAYSQMLLDASLRHRTCSPVCLAMASAALGVAAARDAYVTAVWHSDMHGVWPANIAAAAAAGITGACELFTRLDDVVPLLRAGIQVVVSTRWQPGDLTGSPLPGSGGHLMLLRGVDATHAHVHDPAAASDAEVPRSYLRNEFCRIWLRERGAAYLLLPPSPTMTRTTPETAAPPANERAPDDPAALAPRAAQRDPA